MTSHEIVTDLAECERLWNRHIPKNNIFDIWKIREIFSVTHKTRPRFLMIKEQGEVKGLLPLEKSGYYHTYFGRGDWCEKNQIIAQDDETFGRLIAALPDYTSLELLQLGNLKNPSVEEDEPTYYIDLSKYSLDVALYLKSLSRKHRKNLIYDLKKLDEMNIKVVKNRLGDFPKMVRLANAKFGKDSSYLEKEFRSAAEQIIRYGHKQDMLNQITLELDGAVVAVEAGFVFNGVYTLLFGGVDREVKNLRKFLNIQHIKDAASLGCRRVDFLVDDCGWKELWNCDGEMLYKYENAYFE